MEHRQSQLGKLLKLLLSRKGQRVGLPEIQRLGIAQHGARLKELRALGYVIRNEMEHTPYGTRSWYVLLAEPGEPVPLFANPATTEADVTVSRHERARMRAREEHRG